MNGFQKVAKTTDIPLGEMAGFEAGHREILLAHTDDGFFAVIDECSHDSAPISDGELFGNEVVCPRHGARFDLRTGAVTAPPAIVPIDTVEIKIEGDDIWVSLEHD
jgi:3-phenylpropionate/trans-cinnamate dioxygenase ferredoxin subunit